MSIENIIRQFIKIYIDKNLTQEIDGDELDLGIVSAGETEKFSFYIANESNHRFENLQFNVGNKEVKIIDFPKELLSRAVGELILEWTPSIDIIESLKTPIYIKGSLITG